jgi:hypothetical protein
MLLELAGRAGVCRLLFLDVVYGLWGGGDYLGFAGYHPLTPPIDKS